MKLTRHQGQAQHKACLAPWQTEPHCLLLSAQPSLLFQNTFFSSQFSFQGPTTSHSLHRSAKPNFHCALPTAKAGVQAGALPGAGHTQVCTWRPLPLLLHQVLARSSLLEQGKAKHTYGKAKARHAEVKANRSLFAGGILRHCDTGKHEKALGSNAAVSAWAAP